MSFVFAAPEMVTAAASDLANIGAQLGYANGAAASPTAGLLAAGADEVSVSIAQLFQAHAQQYQWVSARAAAFHAQFVQVLDSAAAALFRILSSMSVTLRMNATSYPRAVSQRRRMSKATPLRTCPMCGRPCGVAPHW